MAFDPDEFEDDNDEISSLEDTLTELVEKDLGPWDRTFVEDMLERISLYGSRTTLSGRQWAQIQRMKEQYNVK